MSLIADQVARLKDQGIEPAGNEPPDAGYEESQLFRAYQQLTRSRQPLDGGFGGIPTSESAFMFDRFGFVEILDLYQWWDLVNLLEKQAHEWHAANAERESKS